MSRVIEEMMALQLINSIATVCFEQAIKDRNSNNEKQPIPVNPEVSVRKKRYLYLGQPIFIL